MKSEELIFLHNGHIPYCAARVDKYFDGYFVLQLMTKGVIELFYDTVHYELEGAWYWPDFPGCHIRFHRLKTCRWWDHRFMAVRGPLVEQWWENDLFPRKPQKAAGGFEDEQLFDALLREVNYTGRWAKLRAINRLETILLNLAEQRSQISEKSDPWIETILKDVKKYIDKSIDYKKLAEKHCVSSVTLRRRFKKAMGISIHHFLIQSRIMEAKKLLAETDLHMKAIAERLGYRDTCFFSHQFRQFVGVPPKTYRVSRVEEI